MRRERVYSTGKGPVADAVYNSVLITRFINKIMVDGKKQKAQSIFYSVIDNINKEISSKEEKSIHDILKKIVDNCTPKKKTVPRRFGGTTYAIPRDLLGKEEAEKTAVQIIVVSARALVRKKGEKMSKSLTQVMLDAYEDKGEAIMLKNEKNRLAEAGAAFAHLM